MLASPMSSPCIQRAFVASRPFVPSPMGRASSGGPVRGDTAFSARYPIDDVQAYEAS